MADKVTGNHLHYPSNPTQVYDEFQDWTEDRPCRQTGLAGASRPGASYVHQDAVGQDAAAGSPVWVARRRGDFR